MFVLLPCLAVNNRFLCRVELGWQYKSVLEYSAVIQTYFSVIGKPQPRTENAHTYSYTVKKERKQDLLCNLPLCIEFCVFPLAAVWTFLSAKNTIFKKIYKILKLIIETWIFDCFVKKVCTFLCKKTELSYLSNCQFHSVLLLELFKTANFSKNLNLRIFRYFSFSNISGTAQDISIIQKVLSLWRSKL